MDSEALAGCPAGVWGSRGRGFKSRRSDAAQRADPQRGSALSAFWGPPNGLPEARWPSLTSGQVLRPPQLAIRGPSPYRSATHPEPPDLISERETTRHRPAIGFGEPRQQLVIRAPAPCAGRTGLGFFRPGRPSGQCHRSLDEGLWTPPGQKPPIEFGSSRCWMSWSPLVQWGRWLSSETGTAPGTDPVGGRSLSPPLRRTCSGWSREICLCLMVRNVPDYTRRVTGFWRSGAR